MSTYTDFDLTRLIEAIESANSAYQVAQYVEHAEVQIADGDSLGQAPQVLFGRAAIARWIDGMAAGHIIHHIVDPHTDGNSVSFVDELHAPDGTRFIHRRTAEISAGQISQEFITVEAVMLSGLDRCPERVTRFQLA